MISVLVVDDHVYLRRAIRYLLEPTPDIKVVSTAESGVEAIAKARQFRPDVVIMDISRSFMESLEVTRQILSDLPQTHVLMLSSFDDQRYIKSALDVGATGYLVKDAIGSELLEAIRSLYSGRPYFCSQIVHMVGSYIKVDSESWAQ